MAKFS